MKKPTRNPRVATLNLIGEITDASTQRFLDELTAATREARQIKVRMSSGGGDAYHGLAIFESLKRCDADVAITVFGCAFSMAAVILQAANHRLLVPSAHVLVHEVRGGKDGRVTDHADYVRGSRLLMEQITKIIADRSDRDLRAVRRLIRKERTLTAEEAIRNGLADRIV